VHPAAGAFDNFHGPSATIILQAAAKRQCNAAKKNCQKNRAVSEQCNVVNASECEAKFLQAI
jgi:hypothetical protein